MVVFTSARDKAIGMLERLEHDRRTAANLPGRNAGRPIEACAMGVLELEMGRLQPEALEPFEEEAEPGGAGKFAIRHHRQTDVLLPATTRAISRSWVAR